MRDSEGETEAMENNFNAIPDIGGYGFGQASGYNNQAGGGAGQRRKTRQGHNGLPMAAVLIVAIAVIVVLAVVLCTVFLGGRHKAKKAVREMLEGIAGDDVDWEEYYPEDLAEEIEDRDNSEDIELEDIISVTRLGGKENRDVLEELVENYADIYDCDADDFDISGKGYMVTCRIDWDGDTDFCCAVVVKVDGKYGIYSLY